MAKKANKGTGGQGLGGSTGGTGAFGLLPHRGAAKTSPKRASSPAGGASSASP